MQNEREREREREGGSENMVEEWDIVKTDTLLNATAHSTKS